MLNAREYLAMLAHNVRKAAGDEDTLPAKFLDKVADACNPAATINDEMTAMVVLALIGINATAGGELGTREYDTRATDLANSINGTTMQ